MANRIPPSLCWLIDKRARIAGEIRKANRLLQKAQTLLLEINQLEEKLKAIDTTLDLHNIKVNIDLIEPIESKDYKLNIPHGELTRSILTCIRMYQSNGPVSAEVIANFVINRHFDFENGVTLHKSRIGRSVHNRLSGLYHKGVLIRHHAADKNEFGLWTLSDNLIKNNSASKP